MRKLIIIISSLVLAMSLTSTVLAQDPSVPTTQLQMVLVNVDADNPSSGDPGCMPIDGPNYFSQGTEEVATSGSYVVAKFILNNVLVWEMLGHGAYNTSNDSIPMWVTEFEIACDQSEVINWITDDIEEENAAGTYMVHGLVPYLSSKVFGLITNGGQYFGRAVQPNDNGTVPCHAAGGGLIKDADATTNVPQGAWIRGQIHDDVNGTPEKDFMQEPGSNIRLTTNGVHLRYWNMVGNCNEAAVRRDMLASPGRRAGHGANTAGYVDDWTLDPEIAPWMELVPIN